jgi:hypothetical protein
MQDFFASARVVDVVFIVVLIEVAVLAAAARRGARTRAMFSACVAVAPGVCLLLALRAALLGADWPWIAVPLTASFPLHLADIWRRR